MFARVPGWRSHKRRGGGLQNLLWLRHPDAFPAVRKKWQRLLRKSGGATRTTWLLQHGWPGHSCGADFAIERDMFARVPGWRSHKRRPWGTEPLVAPQPRRFSGRTKEVATFIAEKRRGHPNYLVSATWVARSLLRGGLCDRTRDVRKSARVAKPQEARRRATEPLVAAPSRRFSGRAKEVATPIAEKRRGHPNHLVVATWVARSLLRGGLCDRARHVRKSARVAKPQEAAVGYGTSCCSATPTLFRPYERSGNVHCGKAAGPPAAGPPGAATGKMPSPPPEPSAS